MPTSNRKLARLSISRHRKTYHLMLTIRSKKPATAALLVKIARGANDCDITANFQALVACSFVKLSICWPNPYVQASVVNAAKIAYKNYSRLSENLKLKRGDDPYPGRP